MTSEDMADIIGHVFGKLTIIGRAPKPADVAYGGTWFTCRCSCGNECVRLHHSLMTVAKSGGESACRKCIVDSASRVYLHKSTALQDTGVPVCGTYTIYCHTHVATQRRYVGMTTRTLEKRWLEHVYFANNPDSKYHFYFHRAIRKHGAENFAHEVLEVVDTLGAAREAEAWWIAHFGSDDHALGYNITAGGDAYVRSAESLAKLRATLANRTPEQVASFVAKCCATRARNRAAREAAAAASSPQLALL